MEKSLTPRQMLCWTMAKYAQLELTGTDLDDVFEELWEDFYGDLGREALKPKEESSNNE